MQAADYQARIQAIGKNPQAVIEFNMDGNYASPSEWQFPATPSGLPTDEMEVNIKVCLLKPSTKTVHDNRQFWADP